MGSYGNLARRAVDTEMPIMVKVIQELFLFDVFNDEYLD